MKRLLTMLAAVAGLAIATDARCDSPGPVASPWPAYPPSCLAYPLPEPAGPTWTARAPLETGSVDMGVHETVNFVFWRSPCKGETAALLGKVYRDAGSANKNPYPLLAGLRITQGSIQDHAARFATEPNTVLSYVPYDFGIADSVVFVFENDAAASIDWAQALDISISAAERTVTVAIPAYAEAQYPSADEPLQLSGYLTGNWYDPAHGGEGAQVEIGSGAGNDRYLVFAWYTYDSAGMPFWLFGLGGFQAGARSATVDVAYATGGGFAGGPSAANAAWGTLTVQFPDCDAMHFTYNANAGLPESVPHGAGARDWVRLTGIQGLGCR